VARRQQEKTTTLVHLPLIPVQYAGIDLPPCSKSLPVGRGGKEGARGRKSTGIAGIPSLLTMGVVRGGRKMSRSTTAHRGSATSVTTAEKKGEEVAEPPFSPSPRPVYGHFFHSSTNRGHPTVRVAGPRGPGQLAALRGDERSFLGGGNSERTVSGSPALPGVSRGPARLEIGSETKGPRTAAENGNPTATGR